MSDPRFCLCVSVPPDTTPARLRGVAEGLLDFYLGVVPGNPEKGGNPLPALALGLKAVDALIESGLLEQAGALVKDLLGQKAQG